MALTGVIRIQFQHLYQGQYVQWQTHCRFTELPTPPAAFEALGGGLRAWWNSYIKPNTANECALTMIKMIGLDPSEPSVYDFTDALPITGTGGASSNVTQLAMLVDHRPLISTRHSRNRFFIPAINATSLNSNGLWSDGQVDAIDDALEELPAIFTAVDAEWGTASVATSTFWVTDQFSVRNNPSTLNRRRIGRGR